MVLEKTDIKYISSLARRISISFFLFIISGCKVSVDVSEKGHVETESGRYFCDEDSVCSIDISDFSFHERFTAIPNEGFVFRWWKHGNGFLCGGASNACELNSAILMDISGGEKLLESDDVYTMSPVFTAPHGSLPLEDVSATSCFNSSMYREGYEEHSLYSIFSGNTHEQVRYNRLTQAQVEEGGLSLTNVVTYITNISPDAVTTSQHTFLDVDNNNSTVRLVRADINEVLYNPNHSTWFDFSVGDFTDYESFSVKILDDHHIERFSLSKGDSYSFNTTKFIAYKLLSLEDHLTFSVTVTYEGMQEVTVPAGTYAACRFRYSVIDGTGVTKESYKWLAKDLGILLMVSDENMNPRKMLLKVKLL